MRTLSVTLFLLLILGCDSGLQPPSREPGIGGEILIAAGTWPPSDSLSGLWLFASKEYPLDSARVVAGVLIEPRFIYLYPSISESLPFYAERIPFIFPLQPSTYPYIGVIQQVKPELLVSNFRVVGLLSISGQDTIPNSVTITNNSFIDGLLIQVDFHHPPPQPFR